jgi:hypothetical protein
MDWVGYPLTKKISNFNLCYFTIKEDKNKSSSLSSSI